MPCLVVSAQRRAAGKSSLVSRGSQQSAFSRRHSKSDDMYEGGPREPANTATPSWESASRCREKSGAGGLCFRERDYSEGLTAAGAGARRNPNPHMLVRTAERSAGGWGEGRVQTGIRPDIAAFKKHHKYATVFCSVAPLS